MGWPPGLEVGYFIFELLDSLSTHYSPFWSTLGTVSFEVELGAGHCKALLVLHRADKLVYQRISEFDNLPAVAADEVLVSRRLT